MVRGDFKFFNLGSNFLVRFLVLFVGVLILAGCARNYPYSVMIRNSGVTDISHAEVDFGQDYISGGWVTPNSPTTTISLTAPFPEIATVRWRRGETVFFEKKVAVKSILPMRNPNEYYTLIFSVNEKEEVEFSVVLCVKGFPCPEKRQPEGSALDSGRN